MDTLVQVSERLTAFFLDIVTYTCVCDPTFVASHNIFVTCMMEKIVV
jgi:hypothetical protein